MSERTNLVSGRVLVIFVMLVWVASSCLPKEPGTAEEYLKSGAARHAAGDLEGAIEDFTHAIALNSGFRKPSRATESAQNVLGSGPAENVVVMDRFNAMAYYNRGNARLEKGDLKGAIRDFDLAIAQYSRYAWAFHNRACAKQRDGDNAGALIDFNRAIQLDPHNALMYGNRGVLRFQKGDLAEAVADYTRAIDIDPDGSPMVFNNRGDAYAAQGKLDRALRDFDRAIEIEPRFPLAHRNRGLVLIRQGNENGAEEEFSEYLRYAPEMKSTLEGLVQRARDSRRLRGSIEPRP